MYNRVLQIQSIQSFKGNFTKKIINADPSLGSGNFHEISLEISLCDLGFVSRIYFPFDLDGAVASISLLDFHPLHPLARAGARSASSSSSARKAATTSPAGEGEGGTGPSSKPLVDVPGLSHSWPKAPRATLHEPKADADWHLAAAEKAPGVNSCWTAPTGDPCPVLQLGRCRRQQHTPSTQGTNASQHQQPSCSADKSAH